jgi:hypothetical protein
VAPCGVTEVVLIVYGSDAAVCPIVPKICPRSGADEQAVWKATATATSAR